MKKLFFLITVVIVSALNQPAFATTMQDLKNAESTEEPKVRGGIIKRPRYEYQPGSARDPFRSYIEKEIQGFAPPEENQGVAAEVMPKFEIQGVIIGGIIPQAIINGKVVREGDVIEGAKIVNITKSSIVMVYKNHRFNVLSPAYDTLKASEAIIKGGGNEKK